MSTNYSEKEMHPSAAYGCNSTLFGDKRLDERYRKILGELTAKPNTSIMQALGDIHQAKACYRFWDNEKVSPGRILLQHKEETMSRISKHDVILAVQDTTDIDLTTHPSVEGLGYLESESLLGIKVHTALAVSGEGQPLGLLWQKQWVRNPEEYGKRHDRKKKQTKDKESQRWIDCHNELNENLQSATTVIHIADRESDIFDLLASPRDSNQHLLIRFAQNRRVEHEEKRIKEALESTKPAGTIEVEVSRRRGEKPRKAKLTARYVKLDILAPLDRKLTQAIQAVKLTAIRVREEEPPADKTGIEWYLLTTLTVNDIEDVKTCTKYYSYRWLIERYHFTLKSGCQVEELQLETVPRLMNAIATYCIVGWRVFYLAYLARFLPETEAENIVTKDELEVLYFQFNPQKMELPEKAPTAREIVIWVEKLGGFAARKSDGMPGVKTLWRGFLSLEYMVQGWVAARSHFCKLSENIKSFSHYP